MTDIEAEPSGGVPGRRAQLLAAAREVLAEHGYERTTVSSIATKASVAQGTFYLYFPSKEALPGALSELMSAEMGVAAERAAEGPSLINGLERLAEESFAVGEAFSDILMIANRGYELATDYDTWLALTGSWRRGLERFLTHYQAAGEVSQEIDVELTAMVIRDVLDRAVKAKILFSQPLYAAEMVTLLNRALSV